MCPFIPVATCRLSSPILWKKWKQTAVKLPAQGHELGKVGAPHSLTWQSGDPWGVGAHLEQWWTFLGWAGLVYSRVDWPEPGSLHRHHLPELFTIPWDQTVFTLKGECQSLTPGSIGSSATMDGTGRFCVGPRWPSHINQGKRWSEWEEIMKRKITYVLWILYPVL